jgi:hypothetical protein
MQQLSHANIDLSPFASETLQGLSSPLHRTTYLP